MTCMQRSAHSCEICVELLAGISVLEYAFCTRHNSPLSSELGTKRVQVARNTNTLQSLQPDAMRVACLRPRELLPLWCCGCCYAGPKEWEGSIIYTMGVLESRIGRSAFWMVPGVGVYATRRLLRMGQRWSPCCKRCVITRLEPIVAHSWYWEYRHFLVIYLPSPTHLDERMYLKSSLAPSLGRLSCQSPPIRALNLF